MALPPFLKVDPPGWHTPIRGFPKIFGNKNAIISENSFGQLTPPFRNLGLCSTDPPPWKNSMPTYALRGKGGEGIQKCKILIPTFMNSPFAGFATQWKMRQIHEFILSPNWSIKGVLTYIFRRTTNPIFTWTVPDYDTSHNCTRNDIIGIVHVKVGLIML